jgi:exosortase
LLRAVGIEVARNGVNLSVPGFDFQVAEACSGMSSLVALTGVTAVFAYLTRLPPLYKWILFFLAVPIALVANAIRVTTIALVGYQWGREAAMGMFHTWSSPILFVAAVVLLFGINWGFEWLTVRRTTS